MRVDPTAHSIAATLIPSSQFLANIAFEPMQRELYVADRTLMHPGIRIFATSDDHEVTMAPLDTGLPPFDLTLVSDEGSGGSP